MRKQASHTESTATSSLRLLPEIGLVDLADPGLSERLAGKVSEQLEAFASQMRDGLLAASVAIGLDVMGELVDAEVTEIAGPKGRHDPARTANRHGSEDGKVTLGGRRIPVRRPRVRTVADDNGVEREVHLESYDTFASVDLLADHMVASMLAGLSGRRYQSALEPVGEPVEAAASGTSQSAVSRRFITATAERLAEFRARPLDGQRWLIVFVDGFDFAGHTMIGALGVTAEGTKIPLGVVEGSTENAAVVRHLITGLRDRGLDTSEGVLFVLDGGKALKTAVTNVFGDHAVIARCRQHKVANVLDALPKSAQPTAKKMLAEIRDAEDREHAVAAAKRFDAEFRPKWPKAADKIASDLDRLLTFFDFPAEHWLHLKTSNPIESTFSTVRLRTKVTKGPGSRAAGLAIAFKLIESAQDHWRAVNGPHLVALVRAGATFRKGVLIENKPTEDQVAA